MLFVGPPGSGKTRRVLQALGERLERGEPATLVVPTASMAEHLLHEMARRTGAVAGRPVLSLEEFVESLTPGSRELSPAAEVLLVEEALGRTNPPEFAAVSGCPGFHRQFVETVQEFWAAGLSGHDLARLPAEPFGAPFALAMSEYERLIDAAGAVHRAGRLRLAAESLREGAPGALFFDGFFHFTPVELDLLRAAKQAATTLCVALPNIGAAEAQQTLLGMGLSAVALDKILRPAPEAVIVRAPSPERELEDAAARILRDHRQTGRPFHSYGIILRQPETYEPLLAVVFERFGLPFRSRRPARLSDHAAIRYLTGLLRLLLGGFDGAETLAVLKLAGSGLASDPQMDAFEFRLRDKLPGHGLAFLRAWAQPFQRVDQRLERLGEAARRAAAAASPQHWAECCAALSRSEFHPPAVEDAVCRATALAWRELARALSAWRQALSETAGLLHGRGVREVSLREYFDTLDRVLRLVRLHTPDRRRNVVQVLSVYEARQWELPVVFVCGLVEKQFPRHAGQNLFFPDSVRRRLALLGLRLRTSDEIEREERFLFDLARTRATEQLYLTYPAQDETGGENLRSFFLEGFEGRTAEAEPVRVREPQSGWRPAPPRLTDPAVLQLLLARHTSFSPTGLERYLQCPFQFFAERTLRLKGPPPAPEKRVDDELWKGSVIHRTIARWTASGGEIGPVFEAVFEEACGEESIRLNFKAEALKMALEADLERFAAYEQARPQSPGRRAGAPETKFEYLVELDGPPFLVTGRIDRYEVFDGGAALVVDYKYSRPERLIKLCQEHEEGGRVQAPLYLLGLERQMGLQPAGMVYYGLRKEPSRSGWILEALAALEPGLEPRAPGDFRALLGHAAQRTVEIVREIRTGHTEVRPRDRRVCRQFCLYREVCRINL